MNTLTVDPLVARTRALAQHELGHFVVATALGFDPLGVSLQVQSLEVHRGKCKQDLSARLETPEEVQSYLQRRIITLLAGALAETLDNATLAVDADQAWKILTEGDTGAAIDYATAMESIQLLHNMMPVEIDPATGVAAKSAFRLNQLWRITGAIVLQNAGPICELADVLRRLAASPLLPGELSKEQLQLIPSYKRIVAIDFG